MLSFLLMTLHFFYVLHMNTLTINFKNDLNQIKNWIIQWKMNFKPGPSKQAQEVIFFRNLQKKNHNPVYFTHNPVQQVLSQKHLGMNLGTKPRFRTRK